jgi:hypothetical protein|tara:strand:+ start:1263 stop:1466 length:204 start_codon:yes stop_codon:yes gene_type:complete
MHGMQMLVWWSMKVGDLIKHKWGKDFGIVVGRPDPARQPPPDNWYVLFDNGRKMVHETSCEVVNESR